MPLVRLSSSCNTNCEDWDYFLDARVRICDAANELSGRLAMYADVASCTVPVLKRSWGELKIRYR